MSKLYVRSLHAVFFISLLVVSISAQAVETRIVRVKEASIERGQQGVVVIEVDALGNENSVGFSLNFNAAELSFVSAAVGEGVPEGTTLIVNDTQAGQGRLGLAVGLPSGVAIESGTRQLVRVTFAAAAGGNPEPTTISFINTPVPRELVTPTAEDIPFDDDTFLAGTVNLTRTAVSVSAASFALTPNLAPDSIVALFGVKLATATEAAGTVPLPTTLAGTRISVRDSAGISRDAPLFFASAGQVNYLIPADSALGPASITVTAGDGTISHGTFEITSVAPGIFAANANGAGAAAAQILRVSGVDQSIELTAEFDASQGIFVPRPIDFGPETDQLFLILYGTGIRFRSLLTDVTVMIGEQSFPALYAGEVGGFVGLDQINIGPLPRSLAGAGQVSVRVRIMTPDGEQLSNPLIIQFQ